MIDAVILLICALFTLLLFILVISKNTQNNLSTEGETVESSAVQSTTMEIDDDYFFPLLLLPKEIIIMIFHNLSTADRMRARVNRALYQIEMKAKFTASMLTVGSSEHHDNSSKIFLPIDDANLDNTRATLQKLADNVSIGYVEFIESGENDLILIPFIKAITSEQLFILFMEDDLPYDQESRLNPHVDEESFNSWIHDRKTVYFYTYRGLVGFSGKDLFHLFNDMASGQTAMVQLLLRNLRQESTRELLTLLGITYISEEEAFTSTMKDSSMFLVKHEQDVAGEYRETLRVDFADEQGGFESGPLYGYVLFIVFGKIRLAVRRWAATYGTTMRRYHNELALEKFDDNEESLNGMRDTKGAYDVSLADMRRNPNQFEKVPPHIFRIVS